MKIGVGDFWFKVIKIKLLEKFRNTNKYGKLWKNKLIFNLMQF